MELTRFAPLLTAALMMISVGASMAQPQDLWVTYKGHEGPGKNLHIVCINADAEYRPEEALPKFRKFLETRTRFYSLVHTTITLVNPRKLSAFSN